jgi:hypothetical protein
MPKESPAPTGEAYDRAVLVAQQSLVVALDAAITSADQSAKLTRNTLFDALARRWSPSYRRARRRGARISYDMTKATIEGAQRELLAVVRFDTLWRIVAGAWSQRSRTDGQPGGALNPLFWVSRASGEGHARGFRVHARLGSPALEAFEAMVERDGQYRRQQKRPLLFAEDDAVAEQLWKPRKRPVRHETCAEQRYNVVNLGDRSERVLSILEGTWVQFNVEEVRADYEAALTALEKSKLDRDERRTIGDALRSGAEVTDAQREQLREHRRLRAFVSGYRRVYRQTELIPVETDEIPYEFGDHWDSFAISRPRRVWIRSHFFRGLNRRYHAANFWPERTPKQYRDRWFSFMVHVPGYVAHVGIDPAEPFASEEFVSVSADFVPGAYVERDVATSQIQTLAVFLGDTELERLAASERPTLKQWLAERAWTQHRDLLADGYEGPDDPRLVSFIKAHLNYFYGGDIAGIIRKCRRDAQTYGPGWRTSRGIWARPAIKPGTKHVVLARGGVGEATDRAVQFLTGLPAWADTLETFLAACRVIAEKGATSGAGVVFPDPLDGSEIQWNPAQRGTTRVGHDEIEIRPWGKDTNVPGKRKPVFVPLLPGTVDLSELQRMVAPCLTHTLDAYFSSLVLEQLQAQGVRDVVALHDAWLVPATVAVGDPDRPEAARDGRQELGRAIAAAGEPWLRGLDGVYDWLVAQLGDDPTFGEFVHGVRTRWRDRVDAKKWPGFLAR